MAVWGIEAVNISECVHLNAVLLCQQAVSQPRVWYWVNSYGVLYVIVCGDITRCRLFGTSCRPSAPRGMKRPLVS